MGNGRKWSPWATYNDGLHRRWMNDAKKACGGSYDILGENLVGGGKVYGEYTKGPVKAGGEYNWDEDAFVDVGGGKVYGEYNKGPVKAGGEYNWDEAEESIGGGRVYGEYNKGPYKAGAEYNWDEEEGDESLEVGL